MHRTVSAIVLGSLGLVVACSAPADADVVSSQESAQSAVFSCRAKREAERKKALEVPAQPHWRQLLLGVMQPVAGVPSIRERLDLAPPNDPLGQPLDAFWLAKRAAGADDLLSMERLVTAMTGLHGVTLELDAIQSDGTYSGTVPALSMEGRADLRRMLWLAKYVFGIAAGGVTGGDVAADRQREVQAAEAWKTVSLPITTTDGLGSTLDQLVAEAQSGRGRAFCSTPGGNGLKALARAADAKYGGDDKTSLSELATFFSETHGATVTLDPWSITYGPAGMPGDAYAAQWGLECARSLFGVAGRERAGVPSTPSPGIALGVTMCKTLDLLALQGRGSRFTGSTATKTMGEKQYEIVMLKASVLQEGVRKILCLDPDNELKLYVRYREHTISECALVNGVYTAAKQGLTGYGYTDNWAAE